MTRSSEAQGKNGHLYCWTPVGEGNHICGTTLTIGSTLYCKTCKTKRSYGEIIAEALRHQLLDYSEFTAGLMHNLRTLEDAPEHYKIRQLYGENFFGIPELWGYRGYRAPSVKEYCAFIKIPFSQELLKRCAETHFLVLVPPMFLQTNSEQSTVDLNVAALYQCAPWFFDNKPDFFRHPLMKGTSGTQIMPGWRLISKEVLQEYRGPPLDRGARRRPALAFELGFLGLLLYAVKRELPWRPGRISCFDSHVLHEASGDKQLYVEHLVADILNAQLDNRPKISFTLLYSDYNKTPRYSFIEVLSA